MAGVVETRTSSSTTTNKEEESAEEKEARLADLARQHVQPIKREYLRSTTEKKEEKTEEQLQEKKQRGGGQNKKRPREATAVTTSEELPRGSSVEKNWLPNEVGKACREGKHEFETVKKWDNIQDPLASSKSKYPTWWQADDVPAEKLREVKLVDFGNKIYVAPLTTVGNLPFRRLMVSLGADVTCAEMSLASSLQDGRATEWAHCRRHPDEKIFGIQIAANYADVCGRACELIRDFCSCDFVDVNMGCPLDAVCNVSMGAGLPRRPKRAESVLKAALAVLPCAVTCKLRSGWDSSVKTAHTFVGVAQSWQVKGRGLNNVFIHGRSRQDRYTKLADWKYVDVVARSQDDFAAPIPVVGNGDILSYVDYLKTREAAPNSVDCAMLGRGALIKPWLPTEIKEQRDAWDISASERFEILRTFVKFGLDHWGSDTVGRTRVRRFLLELLSFTHRYTPLGLLERLPQRIHDRPPPFFGRSDLETLLASPSSHDWIKISDLLLGKAPPDFQFQPKHKSASYHPSTTLSTPDDTLLGGLGLGSSAAAGTTSSSRRDDWS